MRFVSPLVLALLVPLALAQRPQQLSSGEIRQGLEKLAVLGNVLYLAAHPDDENTRFLAYSANEQHFQTAYLSLTRGDGGQNLIGPEIREELGIIRTQELLAARRIDGGRQFFSRANDFGYSKTATETLAIWNRDQVLSDVVAVIRKFRPDVIVCRFPTDGGGGHGHHTASALLGQAAFHLAADPKAFPEQLATVTPWQARRIVVNTGRWWKTDISDSMPGVVAINVGAYNPLLGTSYTEMAARSRTMHKSQGFGTTGVRGEQLEFFEHLDGEQAEDSLWEGIVTDWTRVEGTEAIAEAIQALQEGFEDANPARSLPGLIALRGLLKELPDPFWRGQKLAEVDGLIQACAGIHLEAVAADFWACPGDSLPVNLEMVARASEGLECLGVRVTGMADFQSEPIELRRNQVVTQTLEIAIPKAAPLSQPYWLREVGSLGTYRVDDATLIGLPENPPAVTVAVRLGIQSEEIAFEIPVVYKWNDPVEGERYRPFVIAPPVFVQFREASYLFTEGSSKTLSCDLKAVEAGYEGTVELVVPTGWKVEPASWPVHFASKNEEQHFEIQVTPEAGAAGADLLVRVRRNGTLSDRAVRIIDYEHIPTQVYMPRAQTHLTYVAIERRGQSIGYLPGAGDSVPTALREIGYSVTELSEADLTPERLASFDAILTGIRLLNVNDRAAYLMPRLLAYCEAGGTLVLQYNTSQGLKTDAFAPYPLKLSHDRVTEEDAPAEFLVPEHPVLNTPNKLTAADFEGWVQERGLYFASEWDPRYTPVLSFHDTGEDAKHGGLLVAEYGQGYFVYTGLSFFRELPAGVPGAYRLLVNLLSLGHE